MGEQFKSADKHGSGHFTRDELLTAFKKNRGGNFDENEIDEIIKMVDADGSNSINYSEWAATAHERNKLIANE